MPRTRIDIPLTGGVNLHDDPRRIKDDQCVEAKNLAPILPGIVSSRPALSYLNTLANASAGYHFRSALALPFAGIGFVARQALNSNPERGAFGVFGYDGTVLNSDGFTYPGAGATESCSELNPWMFVFGDTVFCLPGPNQIAYSSTAPKHSIIQITASPVGTFTSTATYNEGNGTRIEAVELAGIGNSDLKPKVGAAYRGRVVWANFGGTKTRYVVMSDDYAPLTVGDNVTDANGRAFELPAAPGDEIVAMQEVMLTAVGSPAQSGLLVLLRYSAYLITGELNQVGDLDLGDMVVNRISTDCGCVSPWTVAKSPYGVLWCSSDDVWLFDAGQVPRRVGTNIRPAIERAGTGGLDRARAIYHNDFYRLTLPGEGQLLTATAQPSDEWWLHLHEGAPQNADSAKWWGPQKFMAGQLEDVTAIESSPVWFKDGRPGQANRMLGLTPGWYTGTATYVMVEIGLPGSRDRTSSSDGADLQDEPGAEILWKLVTKEYDVDAPMLQKVFDGLDANLWISTDGTVTVTAVMDGGYVASSVAKSLSANGFSLDESNQLDVLAASRRPVPVAFRADPTTRPMGSTCQIEMYSSASEDDDDNVTAPAVQIGGLNLNLLVIPRGPT